ncbi:MAG: Sir2 family NAD-dependent protein deacetylase [Pseudomonadota bacterium]
MPERRPKLVILTGAGISAESGLATFRDAGGLWEGHRPEEVATPEAFARDPALVHRFYNARRQAARAAQPNAAHQALAALAREAGDALLAVTQNVDGLHEAAGHAGILHMHGALDQATCANCAATWPAPLAMAPEDPCPACAAPATRPDIVWFGELPKDLDAILDALSTARHFAAIGTSGQVYPAAGFAQVAREAGATCWELTLMASGNPAFHIVREGPATETVPAWCEEIRAVLA